VLPKPLKVSYVRLLSRVWGHLTKGVSHQESSLLLQDFKIAPQLILKRLGLIETPAAVIGQRFWFDRLSFTAEEDEAREKGGKGASNPIDNPHLSFLKSLTNPMRPGVPDIEESLCTWIYELGIPVGDLTPPGPEALAGILEISVNKLLARIFTFADKNADGRLTKDALRRSPVGF